MTRFEITSKPVSDLLKHRLPFQKTLLISTIHAGKCWKALKQRRTLVQN